MKMNFQLPTVNNILPIEGAKIGETPKINIINERILGRSDSSKVSRMTALGAIQPTLQPIAWKNRHTINGSTEELIAQAKELITYSPKPI